MQLALTEDQELIAKTARDFVDEQSPVSRMRSLRDNADAVGHSPKLWREMAELGWLGISFPEDLGGAGMGFAELVLVLEALGRNLGPEPFLSSVLLGGDAVLLGGSEAQRQEWLVPLLKGEKLLALAYQEPKSRYDVHRVETAAEETPSGFTLRGEKLHVLGGNTSDAILVSARTSGGTSDPDGISLFLVPADAAGLRVELRRRPRHRSARARRARPRARASPSRPAACDPARRPAPSPCGRPGSARRTCARRTPPWD